jgi:hypothetical protein
MASNLREVINRDEAIQRFEEAILPMVIRDCEQDGEIDKPARREAWNNFTDFLCKSEEISDWQYENWEHPECTERRVVRHRRVLL